MSLWPVIAEGIALPTAKRFFAAVHSASVANGVRGATAQTSVHDSAEQNQQPQGGGDLVEDRRDDEFSILLSQMRIAGGEFRDEFCPGHRRRPRGSLSTQSWQRCSWLSVGAANQ